MAGLVALRFDSLDLKIVHALQKDARIPFVDIAKDLKVSPGIVQARFNKMKKAGLIKGSTLILDRTKMATTCTASIGIRALDSELEEVISYINKLKIEEASFFSWITFGRYNIAYAIFSKNLIELHRIKQLIQCHPAVIEVGISIVNTFDFNYEGLDLEKVF